MNELARVIGRETFIAADLEDMATKIGLPLAGAMVHYRGWLVPCPDDDPTANLE